MRQKLGHVVCLSLVAAWSLPGRSVPGRCLVVRQFDSDHAECVRCVPSRYHRAVDSQPNKTIFRRLEARGFSPSHVAEVGVYMPETSNVYDYIEAGVRATLVEPDVASIERIEARFGEYPAVTLHRVAAYDYEGELTLTQCEGIDLRERTRRKPGNRQRWAYRG